MEIKYLTNHRAFQIASILLLLVVAILLGAKYLPQAVDWHTYLRPGCLLLMQGKSPYLQMENFAYPIWVLLPYLPFALLPENVGRAFVLVIAFSSFAYSIHKLGANRLGMLVFLLSPPVLHSLLNSNIDWIPLLGFTMPPQIGLFFVSVKPHMSNAVILFWLVEGWRQGGFRRVFHDFWPVTLALLITFFLYGFWPAHIRNVYDTSTSFNASLWPASIPVGLALVVASIRRREIKFAMSASPCLSPYVLLHAWSGALASLASSTPELIAAVVGLWILVVMRFMQIGL